MSLGPPDLSCTPLARIVSRETAAGNSAETSAPEDAVALPGLGGEAAPPLAVAVVRHAERADSHEATVSLAEGHRELPSCVTRGLNLTLWATFI